jgi:hypothetical protein
MFDLPPVEVWVWRLPVLSELEMVKLPTFPAVCENVDAAKFK